jgi:hypothetical protein
LCRGITCPKKEFESEGNLMRETGRRSWIERRHGKRPQKKVSKKMRISKNNTVFINMFRFNIEEVRK